MGIERPVVLSGNTTPKFTDALLDTLAYAA